jgi:hypothetical protein
VSGTAIGADGLPVIRAQRDVVHCGNTSCTAGNTITTVNGEGSGSGIAIAADGRPVLGFGYTGMAGIHTVGTALWVLHCGTITCEDTDGDGTPNQLAADDDGDACPDNREMQTAPGSEVTGGRRNAQYAWDFFDVPAGPSVARDGAVSGIDFFAVLARFGATGDPMGTKPTALPSPAPGYHPSFDRGVAINYADPWDRLPADGSIAGTDFFALLEQFGHNCQ